MKNSRWERPVLRILDNVLARRRAMKKCIVAMMLAFASAVMAGEGMIPPVRVGDNLFRGMVYNGAMYDSSRPDDKTYWSLSRARVWWDQEIIGSDGKPHPGPWYGLVEFSYEAGGERDPNWVRMAYVGRKFGDVGPFHDVEVRFGRIFSDEDFTPPVFRTGDGQIREISHSCLWVGCAGRGEVRRRLDAVRRPDRADGPTLRRKGEPGLQPAGLWRQARKELW